MMKSRREVESAIRAVLAAKTDNFVELARRAGLDPGQDFKNTDLAGCNFTGCNLSGFDFSGSDLRNTNFEGALLEDAIFDASHEIRNSTGFISYAASDNRTQIKLLRALFSSLELIVTSKIKSVAFTIRKESWHRTSYRNDTINFTDTDVFIIILSPAWIKSRICRHDYWAYEGEHVGEPRQVLPIKVARIAEDTRAWTAEQTTIWAGLFASEQCICLPTDFTKADGHVQRDIITTIGSRIAELASRSASLGRLNQPFLSSVDPTQARKILVVDGDELSRHFLARLLSSNGYSTLVTADGVEALRLARHWRPDLILMDVRLPEVSGLEVRKWMKEDADLREIPAIAVTGFALRGDEKIVRDGGFEGYIEKPISIANFLHTVARFVV